MLFSHCWSPPMVRLAHGVSGGLINTPGSLPGETSSLLSSKNDGHCSANWWAAVSRSNDQIRNADGLAIAPSPAWSSHRSVDFARWQATSRSLSCRATRLERNKYHDTCQRRYQSTDSAAGGPGRPRPTGSRPGSIRFISGFDCAAGVRECCRCPSRSPVKGSLEDGGNS